VLVEDDENAKKILGGTGHYDPQNNTIKVYITNRQPKDVLLSFSHELIHCSQQEKGMLNGVSSEGDPQYAQNDPVLRRAEIDAYARGNMLFRDWEDGFKNQ
jgi:hypothetical protein